ncbi:hypothetical protein PCE1_001881 [Barthelona sp. PCE]
MPKKGRGGSKGKKKGGGRRYAGAQRELEYKHDNEHYGKILKVFGSGNVQVVLDDGTTRRCHIRGKLTRARIQPDDLVIVALREFDLEDIPDVVHKYYPHEYAQLQKEGQMPKFWGDEEEDSNAAKLENAVLWETNEEDSEEEEEEVEKIAAQEHRYDIPMESFSDEEDDDMSMYYQTTNYKGGATKDE